jgi:hypothetical protein
MKHCLHHRLFKAAFFAIPLAAVSLASAGVAQASTLPTLSLTVSPSSVAVSGAMQSGGTNVVTTAGGKKEATAVLFLLKPGSSVAEVEAYMKSKKKNNKDPNATSQFGSIVFDAGAVPGHPSEVQTTLVPGEYVALGGEGEGSLKVHTTFTVTAAKSPAVLPTPQATIRSIEFDFRGPTTLHDGELVRFENEGYLVHMDIAFPVKSRSAANQVANGLLTGNEKGFNKLATGAPISFAGPLSHGAYQQETITAKPGWYVQACFMETQEGVPHVRLGMERVFKITK